MPKLKQKVCIICGGKSLEHEVSIQSTQNVLQALDKNKYDVSIIKIDHNGQWLSYYPNDLLKCNSINQNCKTKARNSVILPKLQMLQDADVIFPLIHGQFGEDGALQGLLRFINLPFVGADILGSAICMDKDVSKRLLQAAGLPIAKFITLHDRNKANFDKIVQLLGMPFFIKPANTGSSVGINKVKNKNEFKQAIDQAFAYDRKIIIEECIVGREIECAVLGNEEPIASLPGEIVLNCDFYSYIAKYISKTDALLEIPAKLPNEIITKLQQTAITAFKTLVCEGMARVDFFVKQDGSIIINELNTIPGFTAISMYSKVWEISGINTSDLLDQLIALAIERHKAYQKLQTKYQISHFQI